MTSHKRCSNNGSVREENELGQVKDWNHSEINACNQTLTLVISELDFYTLAWFLQRGSQIKIIIKK